MNKNSIPFRTYALLAAAILAGVAMRFIWPLDIEMKFDEAETFNLVRDWRRGQIPFPWIGQDSSNGLHHPALGVWIFLFFGKMFPVETIVDLAKVPPAMAVVNLMVLIAFAFWGLRSRARLYFLWAIALMAVNPFLVLMDRKLWHPSVMSIFVTGFLLSWSRRETRLGSFLTGLFSLLPGQVHMSGFFMVLGYALVYLYRNRWQALRCLHLPQFLAGLGLSLLPLLSWIYWLFHGASKDDPLSFNWIRLLNLKYPNFWFSNAYGVLGPFPFSSQIFLDSRAYVAAAGICLGIALLGGWYFFPRMFRFLRRRQRSTLTQMEMFSGIGTGFVATVSLMGITRYFTLCLGFTPYLSAVRSLLLIPRYGRALLITLLLAQAGSSVVILRYVHYHPIRWDGQPTSFGVFGVPVGECGNCEVGPTLERISGGTEVIPDPRKTKKAGQ